MRQNNLPVYVTDDELRALDTHIGDGNRSAFIVEAIRQLVRKQGGAFPDVVTDKIDITDDMTAKQAVYAQMYNDGQTYQQIAETYNVTRQTVSKALKPFKGE